MIPSEVAGNNTTREALKGAVITKYKLIRVKRK